MGVFRSNKHSVDVPEFLEVILDPVYGLSRKSGIGVFRSNRDSVEISRISGIGFFESNMDFVPVPEILESVFW
jgi:hypothetical protein